MSNNRSRAARGLLAGLLALAAFASGAVALTARQSSSSTAVVANAQSTETAAAVGGDGDLRHGHDRGH